MRIPLLCRRLLLTLPGLLLFFPANELLAAEKLLDPAFESSTPNGTFPDSGFWIASSAGGGAAAICTTTAGRSGNGLWSFTGNVGSEWWSAPYQEVSAYTGAVFTASAWIRTPPGEPWVTGSKAFVRVDFLGAATNVLASYQSSALTAPTTTWTQFQVTTAPAPVGTTRALYTCFLSKPSGTPGVSVANFDDCSLIDARESLLNSSFEQVFDQPGGPFPTNWAGAWLGESGAVAVRPPDYRNKVLWEFSGSSSNDWWVAIRQQAACNAGDAFLASTLIRTPPGEPWVNGSQAYLRVFFFNASNTVLASYQSPLFVTPNTNWASFQVVTEPAPTTTARVRFTCYLVKPSGSNGQSIVNFDDCALTSISLPGARVSTRAVGLAASQTDSSFELRNTGNAPLTWQLLEDIPWLSLPVSSGTVAPLSAQSISVSVSRAGLNEAAAFKGTMTLKTNDKDIPVDVYMEMPTSATPLAPAEVRFYGRQLRVRDRLPDGSLSEPYHYAIKGSAWSPSSMGTASTSTARRQEFAKWYIADIQLHRAMSANTVYTFLDFGTDAAAFQVLDNLYKNAMKAIVTVDEDGTANSNRLQQIVTAYRNHPAILAWAIGNEWNINFYHQRFTNILDSANATEALARQVKALDPNHPVVAIFGDIDIPGLNPLRKSDENTNQPVSTERIVNDLCPSVDFWGLNIYRGSSFSNLFTQWSSITPKPMFFSEFGTDAYRSTFLDILDGREDEPVQAAYNRGLWNEITANLSALNLSGVCLGGTVFEWNDEWWKARTLDGASPNAQENLGYYGGQADGFANEEWFAIVAADRRVRQSYVNFQTDFAAVIPPGDLDRDGLPDTWEYRLIDSSNSDSIRQLADLLPGDDFDGDHSSNLTEFKVDTDALNPASVLRLTSITKTGQGIRLQWTGGTSAVQYLERTSFLSPTSTWINVITISPPTPATNQFTDFTAPNRPTSFYRIRVNR